jgi:hypothetical protein
MTLSLFRTLTHQPTTRITDFFCRRPRPGLGLAFWLRLSYIQKSSDFVPSCHLECAGAIMCYRLGLELNACVMAKLHFRLPNFLAKAFRINGLFCFRWPHFSAVQVYALTL